MPIKLVAIDGTGINQILDGRYSMRVRVDHGGLIYFCCCCICLAVEAVVNG
jgi:hypothetical protein